ncbi:MAG: 7-carboxy-7-deazaguanine synthase QueE [Bacteroidota bacterium]
MLNISEQFYSIQGEGKTAGTPAVFLRLSGCNLLCMWPCDTIEIWRQGKPWSNKDILNFWEYNGWIDLLGNGSHLVLTGGEPLLQQKALAQFLTLLPKDTFIEVETNATITPTPELEQCISLYNISPKTVNSGIPRERRFVQDTLEYFGHNNKCIFKFVVESREDVEEILREFITPFAIARQRVFLMPQCARRSEFIEKSTRIVELCKEYQFNFSPRLQLMIWDKATGA